MWLCITPDRRFKTTQLMHALLAGSNGADQLVVGKPPDDGVPFVVWGQRWLTMEIVPEAKKTNRPFWNLDNGYWNSAKGSQIGYYRINYRGMSPVLLNTCDATRAKNVQLKPWRKNGKHVLIALPGHDFGRSLGMDMIQWIMTIEEMVRQHTDRPIIIRPKTSPVPLQRHLTNCHALVTHSSNVAVDAVLEGIPVFVEPTSPAAPVGRLDLDIENPVMPDRAHWLQSLLCQQFTLSEMSKGVARSWMQNIAAQVDGKQRALHLLLDAQSAFGMTPCVLPKCSSRMLSSPSKT
jgi:hypothetical protein